MSFEGSRSRNALVLSGGGLFGAWQAGAWSVLAGRFQPDLVVGCSIGALNGWLIASGMAPEELVRMWKEIARRGRSRLRVPWPPMAGILGFDGFDDLIREIHGHRQPKRECWTVMTRLAGLRAELVRGEDTSWEHLAASCALFGVLPQRRIGDHLYTDGGTLGALPLWAAEERGAEFTLGLMVMPRMPLAVRAVLKPLRRMLGPQSSDKSSAVVLDPSSPLGHWKAGILFHHARIEQWIDQGRRDAEAALKHFPQLLSKNISQ